MQKSVLLCKEYGVQVGAHPGLPDLQGFGRRKMAISPAEAEADVMYQIGALKAFCEAAGVPLHHVKPHGALYNMAAKDPALAAAICRAVQAAASGAVLLALSGSEMVKAAHAIGLAWWPARCSLTGGYKPDGTLGAPRNPRCNDYGRGHRHGAGCCKWPNRVPSRQTMAARWRCRPIPSASMADGPKALAFVQKISAALPAVGVEIKAF